MAQPISVQSHLFSSPTEARTLMVPVTYPPPSDVLRGRQLRTETELGKKKKTRGISPYYTLAHGGNVPIIHVGPKKLSHAPVTGNISLLSFLSVEYPAQ